jgi:hypothetical protein
VGATISNMRIEAKHGKLIRMSALSSPQKYDDEQQPGEKCPDRDRRAESSGDEHSASHQILGQCDGPHGAHKGLEAVRTQLLKLLMRIDRLSEQVDEAFAGQPFLPNLPPTAPANRRRFEAYLREHVQLTNLLCRALDLWIVTCGVAPDDDWVRRVAEASCDERMRKPPSNHAVAGSSEDNFAKRTH